MSIKNWRAVRSARWALPASAMLGLCLRSALAQSAGADSVAAVAATIILREASFEDPDLAARGLGRIEVVVRSTDRPTQLLPEARVVVRLSPREVVGRLADAQGLARFDSLVIGNHELRVLRIGYGFAHVMVPVKAGCRTDVEVYVTQSMIGINPPPPMPPRVTITTCR